MGNIAKHLQGRYGYLSSKYLVQYAEVSWLCIRKPSASPCHLSLVRNKRHVDLLLLSQKQLVVQPNEDVGAGVGGSGSSQDSIRDSFQTNSEFDQICILKKSEFDATLSNKFRIRSDSAELDQTLHLSKTLAIVAIMAIMASRQRAEPSASDSFMTASSPAVPYRGALPLALDDGGV